MLVFEGSMRNLTEALSALTPPVRQQALRAVEFAASWDGEMAARAALAAVAFPEAEIPLPSELSAEQLALAHALRDTDLGSTAYALPRSMRARRRWLGVDLPGVFEQPVGGVPRWRVDPNGSGLDLTFGQRIEALAERLLGAYCSGFSDRARLASLVEQYGAQAASWASRAAWELAGQLAPPEVRNAIFGSLAAAGEAPPPEMLVLDPATPERNIRYVRALAPVEREAALIVEIQRTTPAVIIPAIVEVLRAFPIVGAAQHAARRLVDEVSDPSLGTSLRVPLSKALRKNQARLQLELAALAGARPELADALAPALGNPERRR
jgi:hypothetical protein